MGFSLGKREVEAVMRPFYVSRKETGFEASFCTGPVTKPPSFTSGTQKEGEILLETVTD